MRICCSIHRLFNTRGNATGFTLPNANQLKLRLCIEIFGIGVENFYPKMRASSARHSHIKSPLLLDSFPCETFNNNN